MQSIALIPGSDGTKNASLMTVQAVRAPGAATIVVNTVSGVPTKFVGSMGTPHTFTDPITSETITVISDATAVDFAGHVDTGNLVIDNIAPGYLDTNGSKVGDIVIIRPTTQWANNVHNVLAAGALNDDGTFAKTALDTFYKTSEISPTSFVASGGVIALVSGLVGSFTDIVYYIGGYRYTKTGVANYTFTAVKDTYVDVTSAGVLVYTPVANNAASPTLAANSIRLAKVVTSGSAITSVVQIGFDSLGNILKPTGSVGVSQLNTGTTELGFVSGSPAVVLPGGYTTYGSVTATSTGGRVRCIGNAGIHDGNSGAQRSGHIKLTCDGTSIPDSDIVWQTLNSGQYLGSVMTMGETTPTAGSHTWAFQISADYASASILTNYQFSVQEVR